MSENTNNLNLFRFLDLEDLLNGDIHDTILEYSNNFKKIDDVAELSDNAIPVSGTWQYGKRVWNNMPTSGEFVGWVCLRGGVSAPKWVAGKAYSIGDLVLPINDNGHYYECIEYGTSGLVEPIWTTTSGTTVDDTTGATIWNSFTIYESNDIVIPSVANGYYYVCTTGGVSGESEPAWSIVQGETVNDGTVIWEAYKVAIWKEKGISALFKGFGLIE